VPSFPACLVVITAAAGALDAPLVAGPDEPLVADDDELAGGDAALLELLLLLEPQPAIATAIAMDDSAATVLRCTGNLPRGLGVRINLDRRP
jgi:hypothetical protein